MGTAAAHQTHSTPERMDIFSLARDLLALVVSRKTFLRVSCYDESEAYSENVQVECEEWYE
ncbi:hypothetical protein KDK_37350 [Dictyobacter kobayashii]|uniref:Uncharacterized protein n=1 Tax=Dictyobacter kobayashii TaxID=2014872 RepID=A0A402ALM0_9CHLR|nr:hypothetical protein KDK_37350 [Dictyobacter kobayashii]